MANTVLVESKPAITKVGTAGTPLEYYVQTQYQVDDNGKLIQGSAKSFIAYNNSTIPGVKNFIQAAETSNGGASWTFKNGLDGKPVFGADAQRSLKEGALRTDTQKAITESAKSASQPLTPNDQKQLATSTKNQANPTGNPPEGPSVNQKTLEEESASSKDKTRKDYQSIKYPENLNSSFQDCIKFSIIKYQPPGLSGFGESLAGSRFVEVDKGTPKFLDRKKNGNILATITLPIPGGIQDSNTVNWSRGEIDPISGELGNIIQTALSGGNVEETVGQTATGVQAEIAGFKKAIISKAIESGVGANNIMQRQFGTIINPNVELLFNAPELRTFSFSFKLSPRSAKEAQIVKTIIRNFKQAMSVKRSSSSFLLQTPHTFAISYIFKNESHPYLNRFKECALISCNVNYTPEGNYMAFDDSEHPSMVSYQLDLTFQELEPLYDDEYGDEKEIQNIGF